MIKEKKLNNELIKEMRKFFKKNYFMNFRFKENEEIFSYFEFEFMREFHEISKNLSIEEIIEFRKEIIEKINQFKNEIKFKNIKYFSYRINEKIELKNIKISIYYFLNEKNQFEIFYQDLKKSKNNKKMILDEKEFKIFIKNEKKKDFIEFMKKEREMIKNEI